MIISRYHLPTRGTPEVVQIAAADLLAMITEPLAALRRVQPQVRGAIPVADVADAIRLLERALDELRGVVPDSG